jgi:CO/xanthine dehydrogenase FAD-binding subunit
MKPPRFSYHDPTTVEEALGLLTRHGDAAKILAGGQSLMPMLNFRLVRPGHVIDINRLGDLATVVPGPDGGLQIGALVRQRALERSALIRERCPLMALACPSSAMRRSARAARSAGASRMAIRPPSCRR